MITERKYTLGIIGLGNMGSTLLKGIINSGFLNSKEIVVFDIDNGKIKKIKELFKINSFKNLKEIIINSKYILIAVKPQNIKDMMSVLKENCNINENVIISIAAGISTNFFERNIGNISVIRIMPNTPAIYNKGISAISSGKFTKKEHKDFSEKLMKSVGKTVLIDEKFQNLITAISGSGPAYFFLFCKIMIDFAVENGLELQTAKKLVINTLLGAGEILINSDKSINDLIKAVASPGGTTEAALNKFNDNNLKEVLFEALKAALNRSYELEADILKKGN
ncbi:MAG: pyrroline-5-carboxylate reductase [Actinobacteria bacterium]|nr:pyrroline-5-carboxylate reductase [Actinomycetota bacterium]